MNVKKRMGAGALWVVVAFALFASGCASHRNRGVDLTTDGGIGGPPIATEGEAERGGEGLTNRELGNVHFIGDPNLKTVYFDFDSATLRPDARATLDKNAVAINANKSGGLVQIAGHCDERGTQEYNLALGERRALAVREYLMHLGVSGERVVTISYGEEMPEANGHDESAWAQNRRGMFNKETQQ